MGEPQHDWPGDTAEALPLCSPLLDTGYGNSNTDDKSQASPSSVPRLLYGDTSRFGMIKGSIAARKATAAATAAAATRTTDNVKQQTHKSGANDTPNSTTLTAPGGTAKAGLPRQQDRELIPPDSIPAKGSNQNLAYPSQQSWEGEEDDHQYQQRCLGPMGSCNELPRVTSAAELIRTASHDRSSHSVSQARGLRRANVPAAYSEVARTDYYRPSDRIARLYTSTAAALTSTCAQSVAKAAASLAVAAGAPAGSRRGDGGVGSSSESGRSRSTLGVSGKVVTAPFAAESREILQALALQPAAPSRGGALMAGRDTIAAAAAAGERSGNQSPSPTGKGNVERYGSPSLGGREGQEGRGETDGGGGGGVGGGGGGGDSSSSLRNKGPMVIWSAQDSRTRRREMRSPPPRGRRTVEVSPSSGAASVVVPAAETTVSVTGFATARDFMSWNPASLDDEPPPVAASCCREEGGLEEAGSGLGGGGGRRGNLAEEEEKQKESIARYWETVEERIVNGSPNALGAGAKSRLFELPPVRYTLLFFVLRDRGTHGEEGVGDVRERRNTSNSSLANYLLQ